MTKAVIFDLNGILIQSPRLSDRFAESFGVSSEKFVPALKDIMEKVRRPEAKEAFGYFKPYLDVWGVSLTKEQFYNFWFSAEKENSEMVKLARQLKSRGVKIFVLSNNFKERSNYYSKHFKFLQEIFDKVYYSWETGFVKPDPQAFIFLLNEINLKPEECLYFDDSENNVAVARDLGINSHLFTSYVDTKNTIFEN